MKKKSLILVLALALIVATVAGGTLAWLMDVTGPVTNTFTVGDIKITLAEPSSENGVWQKQMIPGYTYVKDPVVTVVANSVDCYLFVKFEEINNPATYLEYTSTLTTQNGWTQGDGTKIPSNVWYREVNSSTTDQAWQLLDGDHITVKGNAVTKENMEVAAKAELAYTAYAHQLYSSNNVKFDVDEAWKNVNP